MAESKIVKKESLSYLQVGHGIGMHTEFLWHSADPAAVLVTFRRNEQWTIARELLVNGMFDAVGEGDVKVSPFDEASHDLCLQLDSPSGRAVFRLNGTAVADFLAVTSQIVPLGAEFESERYRVSDEALWQFIESTP